jgi:zinc dependent phospholipase C
VSRGNRLIAVGSVFPDLDMIWFYFFDHQRTHHHLYWTRVPAFWLTVSAGVVLALAAKRELRPPVALWFFLLGILSHLLLDSIIGNIYWLLPYSHQPFSLFTVNPQYSPSYPISFFTGLVVNVKTAKALHLTIPDTILFRANRVAKPGSVAPARPSQGDQQAP